MWCTFFYLSISFHVGRPLPSLDVDAKAYVNQMQDFKREEGIPLVKIARRAWKKLMYCDDDPLLLTGENTDEYSGLELPDTRFSAKIAEMKQILAVFFGEHERGAYLALSRGNDVQKAMPGTLACAFDPFYRGLSLYAMARRTRKRRFIKEAGRQHRRLKGFVKKGNVNLLHLESILDAEAAALRRDYRQAKKLWETAIMLSRGYLQHTALAAERYGEFLLHEMGDLFGAAFQIGKAITYYREWGCIKADRLEAQYGEMVSSDHSLSLPLTVVAN